MRRFDPAAWSGRDVLLVAPHQDDEAFGCGGAAHLMARAGARVQVLVVALGDGGVDGAASAADREGESRRGCELLGLPPPGFLRQPSHGLREDPARAGQALREAAAGPPPQLVLAPSPLERHPTHRATLLAVLLSGLVSGDCELWTYGVWDPIPAVEDAAEVDITAARSAKALAMSAYGSQNAGRPLAAAIASRDLSQALLSAFTGDERRKAVERLLDLTPLARRQPAPRDAAAAAVQIAEWLGERGRAWADSLWLPGLGSPGLRPAERGASSP